MRLLVMSSLFFFIHCGIQHDETRRDRYNPIDFNITNVLMPPNFSVSFFCDFTIFNKYNLVVSQKCRTFAVEIIKISITNKTSRVMDYKKWTYCPMYYCIFNTKDNDNCYRCIVGKSCDTCGIFSKEEILQVRLKLLRLGK